MRKGKGEKVIKSKRWGSELTREEQRRKGGTPAPRGVLCDKKVGGTFAWLSTSAWNLGDTSPALWWICQCRRSRSSIKMANLSFIDNAPRQSTDFIFSVAKNIDKIPTGGHPNGCTKWMWSRQNWVSFPQQPQTLYRRTKLCPSDDTL